MMLVMIALVYPVVKILHEMGHGIATKAYGGNDVLMLGDGNNMFVSVSSPGESTTAISGTSAWVRSWRKCTMRTSRVAAMLFTRPPRLSSRM